MVNNMEIDTLDTEQLLELYSQLLIQLKQRSIIRSKNLIGDIGEYMAIDYYCKTKGLPNLQVAPIGTKNIDAISRDGERYSIKCTSTKTTGVFYGIHPKGSVENQRQLFEYVIIVILDDIYRLKQILQVDWDTYMKLKHWHSRMNAWNLLINKELVKAATVIFNCIE